MFVSLNKKFIYTIVIFFIFMSLIFLYSFYQTYGMKFQEELQSNIARNQEYVNLLYENNNLKKELANLAKNNPDIKLSSTVHKKNPLALENTISREKKRILELQKSYDDRYASIYEGAKIVGSCSILIIFLLFLLWFLLRRWVLRPMKILTEASKNITSGNLSQRAEIEKQRYFLDETDFLIDTFNNMLDELEDGIREIKKTENFLQKIIDGIPDGLRVIDQNYNIIIANKAYYKQVGSKNKNLKCYEASQHRSTPCSTAITDCPLNEICKQKKKHIHIIQQFAHNPNNHLYINAAPLKIADKLLVIEIIRDLSDDIKFSHQQKLSSLGFMATSVAHEMKNHLGAIRIILERLIEKKDSSQSETQKLLKLILQQIIESIQVPERLLKLSNLTSNDKQKINCYENIKDVIKLMDYEAKTHGINIKIEGKKDLTIIGNENDFKMVLINLILNAIKASKANGEIKLTLKQEKKHVLIEVSDDGCGISQDNLPHIFDPFYSNGEGGNLGGTGLGLAIVKSIMEKHKGEISVQSEVNVGTCFSLRFPKTNEK